MADETEPMADKPTQPESDGDVEGQSLSIAMGLDRLGRNGRGPGDHARKGQGGDVPRLTKPFPRMRDQKRG